MRYLQIQDYFVEDIPGLSSYDRRKLQELRDTINSFSTVGDQAKFIREWRSSEDNKKWDLRILGIEKYLELDPIIFNSRQVNRNYKYHISDIERYFVRDKDRNNSRNSDGSLSSEKAIKKKIRNDKKDYRKAKKDVDRAKRELERIREEYPDIDDQRVPDEDYNFRSQSNYDREKENDYIKENEIDEGIQRRYQEALDLEKEAEERAKEAKEKLGFDKDKKKAIRNSKRAIVFIKFIASIVGALFTFLAILSTVVYFVGGYRSIVGETPFSTCDSVSTQRTITFDSNLFKKSIKVNNIEFNMPGNAWLYANFAEVLDEGLEESVPSRDWCEIYEANRNNPNYVFNFYIGPKESRGNGTFKTEDFSYLKNPDGTQIDNETQFIINMRWEYTGFYVSNTDTYNETPGDAMSIYKDTLKNDAERGGPFGQGYTTALSGLKILVVNPQNGKSCVCQIGDGSSNVAWGPQSTNNIGGLSKAAIDYLEYPEVPNNSNYLETYFIDTKNADNIQLGPYIGSSVIASDNGCGVGGLSIIDTSSASTIASSMCWESRDLSISNDGVGAYVAANNSIGLFTTRSCASFVSIVLVTAGQMPKEKATPGVQGVKNWLENPNSGFTKFIPTSLKDLKPGDVCMVKDATRSHVAIIGSKVTGDPDNPDYLEVCQAAWRGSIGPSSSGWSDLNYNFNRFMREFTSFYRYTG